MPITIFEHNQTAYEAVVEMLKEAGKACVVHPTGTGKSFIAFKYCEDHPEEKVLWLSPSSYIFKTQCENLVETGAGISANIHFCTYSKLSIMEEAEIADLKPDTIIEDEFHRCGARKWQEGMKRLLVQYPDARQIGFSATSIRYLDNQRDMKAEIYDNYVASEMTLGEAIARGILNAPRYVLTSYSLDSSLKKYQSRVQRAKSSQVREAGEKLLEALRRSLENADGLDIIFQKHMTNPAGKYLVFCANIEHLNEMITHVGEWFSKVDTDPHIYYAYADNPAASKAFREFKSDHTEGHLKLLFTIDMLNEGVHVEDISGVILFRPTVSPIVYKQQIGRALSASKNTEPVIFDVVNNIENLYSIGAIEQEIRDAMFSVRDRGDEKKIFKDHFDVFDELRDCRDLFAKLDETLSASWDMMFQCAREYYDTNGNLLVPVKYFTEDGYPLGRWLQTQIRVRFGRQYGKLDDKRIALLDSIGMVWDSHHDVAFQKGFDALLAYRAKYGNVDVKALYVDENGFRLGAFVANLRTIRRSDRNSVYLTEERIAQLDSIGMIWEQRDHTWERYYQDCAEYFREHGNLDIPSKYISPNDLRLGTWVIRLRKIREGNIVGRLTDEQIHRLDAIGMLWDDKFSRQWENGYEHAVQYYNQCGNMDVPAMFVCEDGFALGRWLKRQCDGPNGPAIKTTPEQRERLTALGMCWETESADDKWEKRYRLAKAWYNEHGHLNIPGDYKADGMWISKWLNEQYQIYHGKRKGKSLSTEQITRLEAIGMVWERMKGCQVAKAWEQNYEEAVKYYKEHGDLKIPGTYKTKDGKNLFVWVNRQRMYKQKNGLTSEQIELLNQIGIEWEFDDPWETGFSHAQEFFQKYGNLNVAGKYKSDDGYNLGSWISNQRNNHNNTTQYHKLSKEQSERLESIGMVWRPKETAWINGYQHTRTYLESLCGKPWRTNYVSPDGHKTGSWIRGQLRAMEEGILSLKKEKLLRECGLLVDNRCSNSIDNRCSNSRRRSSIHVSSIDVSRNQTVENHR